MDTENKISFQQFFFQKLKEKIPAQISIVDEIAEVLDLSADGIYRRMRGETELNMNDLLKLAKHFKIAWAELASEYEDGQILAFRYQAINPHDLTLTTYLNALVADLGKIATYENREIIYAARDVPVFHHFLFAELAAFKTYFWLKCIQNSPELEKVNFDLKQCSLISEELRIKMLENYNKTPSIEIWTEETFNSSLKQLQYCWESGFIPDVEQALLICDRMHQMLEHVEKQAEQGIKFYGDNSKNTNTENFKLYCSEVMIGNNNILVQVGKTRLTYISHNTLNYLITGNEGFCHETEQWLRSMLKKSTLLSGSAEKQRLIFFRKCFAQIQLLKNQIMQSVAEA